LHKKRHETQQRFMLLNDSATLAVEDYFQFFPLPAAYPKT
jgi:hypothetical protein